MPALEIKGLQGGFAAAPVGAKLFLLVALLGIMSSGYYATIHMPLVDEIENAERNHDRLQNSLLQAQARQKRFLELREELAGREVLDRQNLRVLPKNPEIPAFLGDINRLAELSGLRIRTIRPLPEEGAEFYNRVPVSIGINGKYHQLAKFFYNISRLERAVNIEDVSLTSPRPEGEDIILTASALATTFRRKAE
jgi:type IV pilus assembly protein PilO